jgi:DNA-binding transcriptional LysR family regulator
MKWIPYWNTIQVMDMPGLKAFVEVAENGSVSRAAQAMHLSQPTISKRIAALESLLGLRLFDRVGRSLQLTDAGRTLLPHARRVLDGVEDGRRALTLLAETVGGRLSIGTSHHIGLHRLPPVLRRFTQRYPDVDLDLNFMDSEVACEAVIAGKLELGVVTLPSQKLAGLATLHVWADPLAVVVAPDSALARKRRVRLHDLALLPAVLPDERTYTHRIVTEALRRHGLAPRVRLATNYLETLKMLVAIGLGWSVLPRSMLDDSIRALRIPELAMQRELGAVWHERRTLSAAARAFVGALGERATNKNTAPERPTAR